MRLLAFLLCGFHWSRTTVAQDCPNLFSCPATSSSSFDAYIRIEVDKPILPLDTLLENIATLYDISAGAVCDPCQRRVTNVEYVSAIRPLLLGFPFPPGGFYDYMTEASVFARSTESLYSSIIKLTISQAGSCTTAFDTDVVTVAPYGVTDFLATCPLGFISSGPTCCCACRPAGYPRQVSIEGLRLVLDSFFKDIGPDISVVDVSEWQELNLVYTVSERLHGTLYTCFETFPNFQTDLLFQTFLETYNQLADEACAPLTIQLVNPSSITQELTTTGEVVWCQELGVIIDDTTIVNRDGIIVAPAPNGRDWRTNPIPIDNDFWNAFLFGGGFRRRLQTTEKKHIIEQENQRENRILVDINYDISFRGFNDTLICPVGVLPNQPPPLDLVLMRTNARLSDLGFANNQLLYAIVISLSEPISSPQTFEPTPSPVFVPRRRYPRDRPGNIYKGKGKGADWVPLPTLWDRTPSEGQKASYHNSRDRKRTAGTRGGWNDRQQVSSQNRYQVKHIRYYRGKMSKSKGGYI
eukprot:scaffold337_cov172-Amphora_coffeaeformis.AAC.11